MIICVCQNISDRDIARAVAEGCHSFTALQERAGGGQVLRHLPVLRARVLRRKQGRQQRPAPFGAVSGLKRKAPRQASGALEPEPFDQLSKKPIFTPASWITSLSTRRRACAPIGVPLTSG